MKDVEFLILLFIFDIWRKVVKPTGFFGTWVTLVVFSVCFFNVLHGVLK